MTGDPLQDVQINAAVSHPRQGRVPQTVPDQTGVTEVGHQGVPIGRIAKGGGGDHAAAWADQEPSVRRSTEGEPFQSRQQWIDDRDLSRSPTLRSPGHQATATGVGLAFNRNDGLIKINISDEQARNLADEWRENAIDALRTESGKQLAQAVRLTDPTWWTMFGASYAELRSSNRAARGRNA